MQFEKMYGVTGVIVWRPGYPNEAFNNAVEELIRRHRLHVLAGRPMLDMGRRPRPMPKANQEWGDYVAAMTTVLRVGFREDWLQLHQDRAGRPVFWRLIE